MRISDWSSDVCSSDLTSCTDGRAERRARTELGGAGDKSRCDAGTKDTEPEDGQAGERQAHRLADVRLLALQRRGKLGEEVRSRSEEHTSELQSLMRISYAVFCLKKKKTQQRT